MGIFINSFSAFSVLLSISHLHFFICPSLSGAVLAAEVLAFDDDSTEEDQGGAEAYAQEAMDAVAQLAQSGNNNQEVQSLESLISSAAMEASTAASIASTFLAKPTGGGGDGGNGGGNGDGNGGGGAMRGVEMDRAEGTLLAFLLDRLARSTLVLPRSLQSASTLKRSLFLLVLPVALSSRAPTPVMATTTLDLCPTQTPTATSSASLLSSLIQPDGSEIVVRVTLFHTIVTQNW